MDIPMPQCASYALEMFSHGCLQSYVIGALVTDDRIQLLYFDGSITLVSEPLNFLQNPSLLIATFQAISGLRTSGWGYAPPFKRAPQLQHLCRKTHIFDGLEMQLSNGIVLRLGNTIFRQHGLIGHGTCVVRATYVNGGVGHLDQAWSGGLIVKLSWPAKSRIPEPDIIKMARERAATDEDRWVLNHLPNVLHTEDRYINQLSQALIDRLGDMYEWRVLRVMVQEELFPITEQKTAPALAHSFHELLKCMCSYQLPFHGGS